MDTSRRIDRRLAAAGAVLLALITLTTHAASPASGRLSPATPDIAFGGGPYFAANVAGRFGGGACVPESGTCDVYALSVELPQSYLDAHPRLQVVAELDWDDARAEFDLLAFDEQSRPAGMAASYARPAVLYLQPAAGEHAYRLEIYPTIPLGQRYRVRVHLVDAPEPPPPASGAAPRYQVLSPPPGAAVFAGEPTLDVDPRSNTPFFLAFLDAYRLVIDDSTSPPRSDWQRASAATTERMSQDPILQADAATGRIFVVQLQLASSVIAYSDDEGASWTTSSGPGQPHGPDHPSLAAGPYPAGLEALRRGSYPDAIYYCSQAELTAVCSRSDDGGQSFNPGVPIYTADHCMAGHGFVTVAPDGGVYVPNQSCDNHHGFAYSADAGLTWQVRTLPQATSALGSHPGIAFDRAGTLYFAYQAGDGRSRVAVSHDRGLTWAHDQDLGARFGIQNSVFQQAVGGDAGRAAISFLGSSAAGNYQATDFPGTWYLYLATTLDGGATWHVVDAAQHDPVQGPGGICVNGSVACTGNRNLYDFNDIAVDGEGRVLAAYADGCIGTCVHGGPSTFSGIGAVARQSGGPRLYAAFDPVEPAVPGAPLLEGSRDLGGAHLRWSQPDDGGSAIRSYRVYRAADATAPLAVLAETAVPTFNDADATATTRYAVTAVNAVGEGSPGNVLHPEAPAAARAACTVPGVAVFGDPVDANTRPAAPEIEIRALSIAEPQTAPGQLAVTLKLDALPPTLPPGHEWRVAFDAPDGQRYYLLADTVNAPDAPYAYGRFGVDGDPSAPVPLGAPDAVQLGSDGSLVFLIAKDKVGIGAAGGALEAISARAFIGDKTTLFDDAGPGRYDVVGDAGCAENRPPLARLGATPLAGPAPLRVSLDASASEDLDGDALGDYRFDFGDGSPVVHQAEPRIEHIYAQAGSYRAALQVRDVRGADSINVADQRVEAQPPAAPAPRGGGAMGGAAWLLLAVLARRATRPARARSPIADHARRKGWTLREPGKGLGPHLGDEPED